MKTRAMIILGVITVAIVAAGFWLWTPDEALGALEGKYLAQPGDLRVVAGGRLHVRDTGPRDAPAIVMIHGFGSSLHTWEDWARALDGRYRVIRYDMPGAGLSAPDATGRYDDDRALEVLTALMDQLGVSHATLVGNSIGGRIAWKYAARYPERVDKLVLVSPDGFASPGFEYGKTPEVPAALGVMRYVLPKMLLRMNLGPAYGDIARLTEPTLDRYYDLMRGPGVRDALLARLRQTVLQDPEPMLRSIKAPVLLVWGEKDGMIPVANAADYQRVLPHSTLAALPGLGHVPMEEAPAVSLAPVEAFLAQ